MTKLPDIGSSVYLQSCGKQFLVKIVSHQENKAIFVHGSGLNMKVGWSFAEDLEEVKPEISKSECSIGQHNYVQIVDAHENSAFCTRCGNTIKI